MAGHQGTWVRQLKVAPDHQVEPVCSPAVLDPAIAQVGVNAVEWAVRLGSDIAVRCVENFPEFGTGPAQIATVRWGTESAAITALRVIDHGDLDIPPVTEDTVRAIQDYVHRGIPLPIVWAAVRQGHAWLAEAYMRACVDIVPVAEQPNALRTASEALFGFIDKFSDDIGREYGAEHERWIMTTVAAREEVVNSILAGSCTDLRRAEHVLHYTLGHRSHVGVILWFERRAQPDDSTLHKLALTLLHAAGAEQTLIVPHGLSSLYAWGNSARTLNDHDLGSVLDGHDGIRAAVGGRHAGVDGFVRSHHEAREARAVAEALPGLSESVLEFDDVRLPALLVHDMAKVRRFVGDVLGPLAGDDHHTGELRKTAAAYLRLRRSPLAVANELYVVRNTVSYRLKKAEELLGRSLDDRTLETWAALLLRDGLTGGDEESRVLDARPH